MPDPALNDSLPAAPLFLSDRRSGPLLPPLSSLCLPLPLPAVAGCLPAFPLSPSPPAFLFRPLAVSRLPCLPSGFAAYGAALAALLEHLL